MMRKLLFALLWFFPGYFVGLFGCLWLMPLLGQSSHIGSVEAATTGAFVGGPLVALLAAGLACWLVKPRR